MSEIGAASRIRTAEELDQLGDAPVVARIPSIFLQLLQKQPGTAALFHPVRPMSPGVVGPFIPDLETPSILSLLSLDDRKRLNKLAVLLVGEAISKISASGFAAAIQVALVERQLAQLLASGIADRVATAIYAVKFHGQFASVIPGLSIALAPPALPAPKGPDGPNALATAYAEYVTRPGYLAQKLMVLGTNPPNGIQGAQLVTYKLKSLSASAYQEVVSVYQKLNLPVFQSTWTNLVSIPLLAAGLAPVVQERTNDVTTELFPSLGPNSLSDVERTIEVVTLGTTVDAFIRKELGPRGLTTHQKPSNTTIL